MPTGLATHPRDTRMTEILMYVIEQSRPSPVALPGIAHATWVGHDDGVRQVSVWRQSLAPGAATPPHRHDCDEVVLCLAGRGQLHVDGQAHPFGAGNTLVLPRDRAHQLFNTGAAALEIIGIFGASPVGAWLSDGRPLDLPWRS